MNRYGMSDRRMLAGVKGAARHLNACRQTLFASLYGLAKGL